MAPRPGGCRQKLHAIVSALGFVAALAKDNEVNRSRRLQDSAGWDQVASAISQGYCAQNYDVSSVSQTMDDDPAKWVDAHNYYRACHGSPPVTWDNTLALYAKNWVEVLLTHCNSLEDAKAFVQASGHEPHDPAAYRTETPKNGENLALFEFPVVQMLPMDETSTVESWYREIDDQCANKGLTPGCDGGLNHFTALVWKSVNFIGCYSASRGTFKLVSCRYAPGLALEEDFCNLPNAGGDCATKPENIMVPALLNDANGLPQHCEPHGVIGVNGLPNGGAMDIAGQKVIPLPLLLWGWLQRAFTSHNQAPDATQLPPGTLPQDMMGNNLPQGPAQAATPQRLFAASPPLRSATAGRPTAHRAPALAALAALAAVACAVAASRARGGAGAGIEGRTLLGGSDPEL
ncbi:unnamed protein product [Prorocentrum cordatum]|uniref:SCP domain-containing protein n=1 Tax=Prorocentrum cordatum TaxID=2364126 RepID=A0ABN9UWY0_9DINO|nr:unnamed protein product [Polarella glacialis]